MLDVTSRFGRICLILAATISAVPGCCPDSWYEILSFNPTVRLPLDESPHCSGGEWWYYSGRVVTEDGAGYGIEAVIFHVARVPLVPEEAWAAHFSVLDEASGVSVYHQTRLLSPRSRGSSSQGGFDLDTGLLQMTGSAGRDRIRGAMPDDTYAIDLLLEDERGVVLHGGYGYIPYGLDGHSFYYSRPRMQAHGTLQVSGQTHEVNGTLWFDRQWGRDLRNPWLPWDWFSLRLDDGTDVMLFVFRDETAPVMSGTFIPRDGDPSPLGNDDFVITPTAWWTSPHTGITYPVGWEISILPQQLSVTVTAVANDQEFDARATTLNIYWEGLCTVTGDHAGQEAAGFAYVELTNYGR